MAEIKIVGAGVVGLTTAVELQGAGHRVSICAEKLSPETTSDKASAVWWPMLAGPVDDVVRWSAISVERFRQLASDSATGVSFVRGQRSFRRRAVFPWIDALPYVHELGEHELAQGCEYGLELEIPVADMSIYMPWLMDVSLKNGGSVERRCLSSLAEVEDADIVVNCTGLGARELAHDEAVYPARGRVVVIERIDAPTWLANVGGLADVAYVYPRTNDIILGGTYEVGVDEIDDDAAAYDAIVDRCSTLLPEVRNATRLRQYSALRPCRDVVRVGIEPDSKPVVVHNYGNGGAGMTLSWGTASDVNHLVEALLHIEQRGNQQRRDSARPQQRSGHRAER